MDVEACYRRFGSMVYRRCLHLLRDEQGHVESVLDRHVIGLFPRDTWWRLLDEAGFERVDERGDPKVETGELFLARKR